MRWKNGQEFVQVYTSITGPNVRLLEQVDRISNIIGEPGTNGSPMVPHKLSVRMLIINTPLPQTKRVLCTTQPVFFCSCPICMLLHLKTCYCTFHEGVSNIQSLINVLGV